MTKANSNNKIWPLLWCDTDKKNIWILNFIISGTGEGLFDHIAECLSDFVYSREIQDQILPLGFTFSFPCAQEGLAKAKLVKWTKGFSCSDVEGHDVVQKLQEAIQRRGDVKIEVVPYFQPQKRPQKSNGFSWNPLKFGKKLFSYIFHTLLRTPSYFLDNIFWSERPMQLSQCVFRKDHTLISLINVALRLFLLGKYSRPYAVTKDPSLIHFRKNNWKNGRK